MRAVDTNVLVRIIARDDPRQTGAAEAFVADGAWLSHLVLAELAWVLESVYDFTAERIATVMGMLLDHASLTVQDPDVVAAALEAFRERPAAGFSDCLILAIARRQGHLPLGSFDRALGRLPGVQRL
jgi:predicted nucleic-acid-binding protein